MFHHYFSQIGLASPLSLTRIELQAPIVQWNEKKRGFLFVVFTNFVRLLDPSVIFLERKISVPNASHPRVIFNFKILIYILRTTSIIIKYRS